jgi:hypothetical protein
MIQYLNKSNQFLFFSILCLLELNVCDSLLKNHKINNSNKYLLKHSLKHLLKHLLWELLGTGDLLEIAVDYCGTYWGLQKIDRRLQKTIEDSLETILILIYNTNNILNRFENIYEIGFENDLRIYFNKK